MNHFSLFTGIGGIDLAAEWAGFTSVGQCEWADFQTKVLEKHWPNLPRWRDIRNVTSESVRAAGIERVDLITGGFPCQPFSLAGQRGGTSDDRYLWPEMLRVISELQPTWVIGENVAGLITMDQSDSQVVMEDQATICKETEMVLETIRQDLERVGYQSQPVVIPACAVNARHRRDRIFILAHSTSQGLERKQWQKPKGPGVRSANRGQNVAHSHSEPGLQADSSVSTVRSEGEAWNHVSWGGWTYKPGVDWWATEPDVGRVVNGISTRMDRLRVAGKMRNRADRLKSLGNAVVPQQVYPILKAIADIERGD